MVTGLDNTKVKKKPWKTQMERDIYLHKDLAEAYYQRGKAMGGILDKVVKYSKKEKESDK